MAGASRLTRAIRVDHLTRTARAGLLRTELARRLKPRATYATRVGVATVHLSHDDYAVDRASLAFVVVDEAYAGDYRDAFVVDIGAHKGYYAAYALDRGARAAVSYEPEAANFALLERAAGSVRDRGGDWRARRCAVGARGGEADLHVMGASWGHALHPPQEFARYEVGVERVQVEALRGALAEAVDRARGARVIVKINVEGEECATVLGTPASAWRGVHDVYIETHPWATCGADELASHLQGTGFRRAASAHPAVLRLRR